MALATVESLSTSIQVLTYFGDVVFAVSGALEFGSPLVIAVFMGMVTATGGGLIRDAITNTQPMILSGQPYATVALVGALSYATLRSMDVPEIPSEVVACGAAFALRAWAIVYDVRMGPPGQFLRIGKGARRPDPLSNETAD